MKKIIALGLILLLLIFTACSNIMSGNTNQMPKTNVKNEEQKSKDSLESKFALLSTAGTNFCAKADFINSKSNDDRLQGSCCSKMDFHRYSEQVEGLKKYSDIKQIPQDPYDIPVPLAKELLGYKNDIKLTAEQQMIYDEAVKMSHEKGPCCCKCWRWDAFEGLAKFLITEHGFNAAQVADVWDLADGCGGKGHEHGNQHSL
jgi:hypothetical protein